MTNNLIRRLSCRDVLVALGLTVLVTLAGSFRMVPGVCGLYHDDAIYVSTAKSLAEGHGYRLRGVPEEPLQTKYPILYPALLAVVWDMWPSFPNNLLVMQGISLLAGAATVGLCYLYFVRFGYFSRSEAAAAGVLCATCPSFLYFSTHTMAEMPFALLMVVALWAVDRQLVRPSQSRLAHVGLGIVVALPFLCRTIGAPLIPAALWVLFRSRQRLRWYVFGMTATSLPWILWSVMGRGIWDANPTVGYYTDYLGCWSSTGTQLFWRVVLSNAFAVAHGSAVLCLEGLADAFPQYGGSGTRWAILVIVGVAPWMTLFPQLRDRRILPWAVSTYLLITLVWSWPPFRFLLPILPFIAAYLVTGLAAVVRSIMAPLARRITAVLGLGLVVGFNVNSLIEHRQLAQQTGYPRLKVTHTSADWSSYEKVFSWIRQNCEDDDVLACGLDSMIVLYTDCKAVRPYVYRPDRLFYGDSSDPFVSVDELTANLKRHRARYLVQLPMPGFAEEKLIEEVIDELYHRHAGWLVSVYQGEDPRFVIFALDPQHEPNRGIAYNIFHHNGRDKFMHNNLLYANDRSEPIVVQAAPRIYNNTIVDNTGTGIVVGSPKNQTVKIANSIIVGNGHLGLYDITSDPDSVFESNIVFGYQTNGYNLAESRNWRNNREVDTDNPRNAGGPKNEDAEDSLGIRATPGRCSTKPNWTSSSSIATTFVRVVAICEQQGRIAFAYLCESVTRFLLGEPALTLLPADTS